MPKFDENTGCHFFPDEDCRYPITEDEMRLALEEWDEEADGDILSQIPVLDSPVCTNCLLCRVLERLNG